MTKLREGMRRWISNSSALANTLLSLLIKSMNNIGDKGSPYLRPRRCQIGGPGSPWSITQVLAVDNRMATSSLNLGPNPAFCSTSNSSAQETESNALAIQA